MDAEEIAERRCMLKGIHPVMKSWYNSDEAAYIKGKYGPFPLFWQDLEHWPHCKILQKVYLSVSEKKEAGIKDYDVEEVESAVLQKLNGSFSEFDEIQNETALATADSSSASTDANSTAGNDSQLELLGAKKKRNRWGAPQGDVNSSSSDMNNTTTTTVSVNEIPADSSADPDGDGSKKVRRSRWSANTTTPSGPTLLPGMLPSMALSQEAIQQSLVLKMQLQQANERMITVVQDAARIEQDPQRSPSPPPRYDSNGKRLNTREVRMRESLIQERGKIIEELMKLNPAYQPPADFIRAKPVRRLPIPYKEYPQYNFIGLIIGPRGNTQKKMEQETGCKISIRGKGSVKEGSKGRATKVVDEDEDLHVHVTGDDEEKVELATKMVMDLLRPVDDEINEHKQKQLRELVAMPLVVMPACLPACSF